jgi:hypothetical protein
MASDGIDTVSRNKAEKAERLAQALRANLRRRKAQASARKDETAAPNDPPETPAPDEGKP